MSTQKRPFIHSTDLFHPPRDPDDHFDLATLFSLPELDIRGIVLDQGGREEEQPGIIPVKQMMHIMRRKVPYAVGLGRALKTPEDSGFDQSQDSQRVVAMILEVLRSSSEKVTIFTTGSLRDMAASFNRDPSLFKNKVDKFYINAGRYGDTGRLALSKDFIEYNVEIDRYAFLTIMRSGLPMYWCPCFGEEYGTFWTFQQREVLDTAPLPVQNYFVFALTKRKGIDPITTLSAPLNSNKKKRIWKGFRNMWCTAPFIHAAGRKIYKLANERYVTLTAPPNNAKEIQLFEFVPAFVSVDNDLRIEIDLQKGEVNMHVFRVLNKTEYGKVLTSCLRELFKDLGH